MCVFERVWHTCMTFLACCYVPTFALDSVTSFQAFLAKQYASSIRQFWCILLLFTHTNKYIHSVQEKSWAIYYCAKQRKCITWHNKWWITMYTIKINKQNTMEANSFALSTQRTQFPIILLAWYDEVVSYNTTASYLRKPRDFRRSFGGSLDSMHHSRALPDKKKQYTNTSGIL